MKPTVRAAAVVAATAIAGAALARPGTPTRRAVNRAVRTGRRRMRDMKGRREGLLYHARNQHPDPDVPDLVIADRIRSELGVLEKQLDLPRIHVYVVDHVAHLHGVVGAPRDIAIIEDAVVSVSGVREVESALHVGLNVGDTRPSVGRLQHDLQWSDAKQRLVDGVTARDIDPDTALSLVQATLETFAERLPLDERDHVAAHLPADVRAMFVVPRHRRRALHRRRMDEFVRSVVARSATGLPDAVVIEVARDVVRTLRALVPEEAEDVAAVLAADLRELWTLPSQRH